ncbi:MAG: MBL fold metallo-hydrolase [Anaerolineae bacterium]
MGEDRGPYVVPLGVSAALPGPGDANSYVAVVRDGRFWLIDCAGSPIQRLMTAGLDPLALQGVFVTHFHPDHIYGLPALALGLFLIAVERGHTWAQPVPICARPEVLTGVEALLGLFAEQGWLASLPFTYREVAATHEVPVATTDDFVITASPSAHSVPSMAVRFATRDRSSTFVYSGDTAPCDAVLRLSAGADLLIHEATDEDHGHTAAEDAGRLAAEARVKHLGLIHYQTDPDRRDGIRARASKAFGQPVTLVEPYARYYW